MPAPNHEKFDFGQLTFSDTPKPNRNGGKTVRVGYGPSAEQVEFQLGTSPLDTLESAWGVELANRDDPESGLILKLVLTEETQAFLERFDEACMAASRANSQAWFNKATPNHTHVSCIKPQGGTLSDGRARPDTIKIKVKEEGSHAAKVSVTQLTGDNGHTPKLPGTIHDIVKGSRVLARLRVANGVWFYNKTFGTSLELASALVVLGDTDAKDGELQDDEFDMGDCVVVEPEANADDTDSCKS